MEKLFCFVDETGQDTQGLLFIVVAVVTGGEREPLEASLLTAERSSGSRRGQKWVKSTHRERMAYLDAVLRGDGLRGRVFYRIHAGGTAYLQRTAEAIVQALTRYTLENGIGSYRATAVIDGLNEQEQRRVRKMLSQHGLRSATVRGARDESSAAVRLADMVAGLVRDAEEGRERAVHLVERGTENGLFARLEP